MQKGTVSEDCWNTVKAAGEYKMNWGLFEGCKRERSLNDIGMQSMELIRIQCIGGCLKDAKGNGL
ncbi:Uncharacterized protein APZ42_010643 [Daphnia magna]|uniref:Uncharacterized protein n=1 Tax=Daphnia magna TaxID=35525 RepID=A0A164DAH1_9CRUS|nr:Uncharacterized protein APZ42_010643 [Daphnia magna]